MNNLLKLILGLLLTFALFVFGVVRVSLAVIGMATAPEDYAAFKARMPEVAQWLFTTPWPVPTLIVVLMAVAAAYLLFTGTRRTVQEAVAEAPAFDEAKIREIVRDEILQAPLLMASGENWPPEPPPSPPNVRLTAQGRERLDAALIDARDYIKGEFADFLEPWRQLLNWKKIMQSEGAAGLHEKVEALRPGFKEGIDRFNDAMRPHFDDFNIIPDFAPMNIKTKTHPLSEAAKHLANVTGAISPEASNPDNIEMQGREYSRTMGELQNEIDNQLRHIAELRRMIAQGEI
jgi:hypothetical protein